MSRTNYKLLIVEDSPEDREHFRSLLCNNDDCEYLIDEAGTGAEALKAFEARDYDCILLDYQLPDMDGIRILEKMAEKHKGDLPVVMITGQGDEKLAVRALRLGAADYFVKSTLTPENLLRSTLNAVHRHQTAQQLTAERNRFAKEQRERLEAQEREIEALAEVERQRQRLEGFFHQIPTPVAVLKGQRGVFEFLNEPMKELIKFGGHEHKFLATVGDCLGEEVEDIVRLVYESGRAFRANEFEIERKWEGENPQLRYFQLTVDPLREISGRISGAIMMLADVTASVKARHSIQESELRARESEDRFRQIAEVIPHMIWVMDARGNGEYFNSSFLSYTGSSIDENYERGWLQWVHPSDRPSVTDHWQKCFRLNENFEATYRLRRVRDGEYRWHLTRGIPLLDSEGHSTKWYGSASDIHDQRTLTESLRDSEQRLRVATETSRVGVWEIDVERRNFWRNAEHDHLFGYESRLENWSIETLLEHVIAEDRARVAHSLYSALEERRSFEVEFQVLWPNHTLHWMLIRGGIDRAANGRLRLAGTNIDVTDRKLREQDLRDARNNAVAANETKTMFLANMSHEIRTPLNAIMGFTDLISSDETKNDDRRKYAQTVQRNGRALMQIIDDILDLSKIEAGKFEVANERTCIKTILDDVLILYSPLARERGLTLLMETADGTPECFLTDPVRLRQIIMNVVSNAIKFTKRGSVTLTARASVLGRIANFVDDLYDHGYRRWHRRERSRPPLSTLRASRRPDDPPVWRNGLRLNAGRRLAKLLGGTFYLVRSRVGEGSTLN